jgi:hypothetical protein
MSQVDPACHLRARARARRACVRAQPDASPGSECAEAARSGRNARAITRSHRSAVRLPCRLWCVLAAFCHVGRMLPAACTVRCPRALLPGARQAAQRERADRKRLKSPNSTGTGTAYSGRRPAAHPHLAPHRKLAAANAALVPRELRVRTGPAKPPAASVAKQPERLPTSLARRAAATFAATAGHGKHNSRSAHQGASTPHEMRAAAVDWTSQMHRLAVKVDLKRANVQTRRRVRRRPRRSH